VEKEKLEILDKFIQENRGKRKFAQSVELSVNFKGIDFSKQDDRLNVEISLPNGKGKESSVIVFADDRNIADSAGKLGARVIGSAQLPSASSDKAMLRNMLKSELVAQPSLMPAIAKNLGQLLGPRNKMPKPLLGSDISGAIKRAIDSVQLRSKGKYLPTVHCVVGKEGMETQKIAENIDAVMAALAKKPGNAHIRSAYVKLTMSKPVKIIG
jgi:large subunit ribosomal protein L1